VNAVALAAAIAGRIYDSMAELPVLFVGNDELTEQFAGHFAEKGARVAFAPPDAEALGHLHKHDIVACFGGAPPIGRATVESALRARKRRPLLLLDLGREPKVAPDVESLEDVFVYKLKDLQRPY
jgi:glutamyl-tRNA reductase